MQPPVPLLPDLTTSKTWKLLSDQLSLPIGNAVPPLPIGKTLVLAAAE
jgi:hypothetical protein